MASTSPELAWDITDWDKAADLGLSNIRYNFRETFLNNSLVLPASIICREDQRNTLLKAFAIPAYDEAPFHKIDVGFGPMKLKVLPVSHFQKGIIQHATTK